MSYPGGKAGAGVAETIINQQPPHSTYIEPFVGGGAVLRKKLPADTNIACDLDQIALTTLQSTIAGPFDFYVTDGLRFLTDYKTDKHTLIYCDPPYPFDARLRQRRIYRHEMSIDKHVELLALLRMLPAMVQVSAYAHPMYAEMLRGWRLLTFQAMTRGGPALEHLWMNYDPPQALHDYRFLGQGFRERERIKRKTARMLARLAKLPPLERLALSSAMHQATSPSGHRHPATQ